MRASHRQENRVKKGGMADEEQGHGRCGAVRLSFGIWQAENQGMCGYLSEPGQIFGEDEEEAQGEDGIDARQARAVYMMRKRLAEGRQLFAGNLKEMADMMNHVADESVRFISLGNRRQKQIMKGLLGEGLIARDIYLVQKGDGRMELSILLSTKGRASRTVEEAADYLSVLLDMRLMSARRNPFFIGQDPVCFFFEEEPFLLLYDRDGPGGQGDGGGFGR